MQKNSPDFQEFIFRIFSEIFRPFSANGEAVKAVESILPRCELRIETVGFN